MDAAPRETEHEVTLTVRVVVSSGAPNYSRESAEAWAALVLRESTSLWSPHIVIKGIEVSR